MIDRLCMHSKTRQSYSNLILTAGDKDGEFTIDEKTGKITTTTSLVNAHDAVYVI